MVLMELKLLHMMLREMKEKKKKKNFFFFPKLSSVKYLIVKTAAALLPRKQLYVHIKVASDIVMCMY